MAVVTGVLHDRVKVDPTQGDVLFHRTPGVGHATARATFLGPRSGAVLPPPQQELVDQRPPLAAMFGAVVGDVPPVSTPRWVARQQRAQRRVPKFPNGVMETGRSSRSFDGNRTERADQDPQS